MGRTASPLVLAVFDCIIFILAGNDDILKSLDNSKFSQLRPWTTELAAIGCQKKIPIGL